MAALEVVGFPERRVMGEPSLGGDLLEFPFAGSRASAACKWRDALVWGQSQQVCSSREGSKKTSKPHPVILAHFYALPRKLSASYEPFPVQRWMVGTPAAGC